MHGGFLSFPNPSDRYGAQVCPFDWGRRQTGKAYGRSGGARGRGVLLHLRHCSIQWEDYGARLVFPGGKEISAWPHPEQPHYHVISHRCGYGDDLLAYCREHELAHIVSAELFRGGPSPVLYALAHGEPVDQGLAVWEELTAMALQRWVRANERPIVGNVDWDQVKATFIGYAAQLDGALVCRAA